MKRLIDAIGEAATLELLAEECTELAHAALKLARVQRGENPTPMSLETCAADVIEESVDVTLCLQEIADCDWNDGEVRQKIWGEKTQRMQERLKYVGGDARDSERVPEAMLCN